MPKQEGAILDRYWHKSGVRGCIARVLRPVQFLFAIIVAALYGIDLAYATKTNTTAPAEWVYAELAVTLSAITCIVYFFVPFLHAAWSTWDGILFVFWLAQTGVFGNIYISGALDDHYKHATLSIPRMRAAVWIDLINMLLWLFTFILGIACCCRTRKPTSQGDDVGDNKDHFLKNDEEECLGDKKDDYINNDVENCSLPEYKENPDEDLAASLAAKN
ncbi:uncharacterized protein N7496_010885 [Penicillium cataractarum]|uniref:MARVEL domain-containing protein n=1 Tax=Penicillium cataractarum TaxID=2100454 RepID=A0A9W9REE0_9EURO|nr:uncharacterized protein N7496_010885 [Penicillium cataractarum]KAJ5358472.1 hypothetical protein N7496_010885 [Penicillium cataractarum]